jgi:hypothetical protein
MVPSRLRRWRNFCPMPLHLKKAALKELLFYRGWFCKRYAM